MKGEIWSNGSSTPEFIFPPSLSFLSDHCQEECLFNAVCVVEQLSVRCSCDPIECDAAYRPVCDRDGRTHANDCARRKAECLAKALIHIKHQGPCGEWNDKNEKGWKQLLLCPSKIAVFFFAVPPLCLLFLLQENVMSFFLCFLFFFLFCPSSVSRLSVCVFLT